ncbi:FAD/FMN-containing dehydrogenase [Penicillium taxi]|uniref:FAD/FMN-containing dehydrogenase n=1 Tax=Penicillium taxi TaxID=168475 RepID=UPI002544F896|nr:FAD/FMN-containing dehydrogenase [Penicillium taxi]KAJ5893679.1 FAD/FMN-containing dehydrogenase [Penicillium taxi]
MIGSKSSLRAAFLSLLALNSSGAMAYRWFNWQTDVSCEATGFFAPQDEADLVNFVKTKYPVKAHLKPIGNGHGFGNLTTCVNDGSTERDSFILSLTNLKSLTIHKSNNTVTIGGGWDLIDLIPELHENGLQVNNLGSEMVQNYIGAATTGTHGTGKSNKNLSTQIIGLRVLDAKGNIHHIDEQHNPELLKAFRVGIGALGIIVEVTLQAEPLSFLKRTSKVFQGSENITELYQQIAEIGRTHEQINILGPNYKWDLETETLVPQTNLTLIYWEETNYTGATNCSVDFCSNDCGRCDRDYSCYDYKMDGIATPPQGICYRGFMGQFEHFFPIENLPEIGVEYSNHALSQADRMKPYQIDDPIDTHDKGYSSADVTVITRFVKGDDTWISPVNTYNLDESNSGVFATLEYSWVPSYNNWTIQYFSQELLKEFIPTFGEKYNVRPHWNKGLYNNDTYAETIYPNLHKWLAIQEHMDPHCQFVNPYLADRLGIDRCKHLFSDELLQVI